jgi:hypothetical protein
MANLHFGKTEIEMSPSHKQEAGGQQRGRCTECEDVHAARTSWGELLKGATWVPSPRPWGPAWARWSRVHMLSHGSQEVGAAGVPRMLCSEESVCCR